MDAKAGLRLTIDEFQALRKRISPLLSMGSLSVPMSSNARSIFLEIFDKGGVKLGVFVPRLCLEK